MSKTRTRIVLRTVGQILLGSLVVFLTVDVYYRCVLSNRLFTDTYTGMAVVLIK